MPTVTNNHPRDILYSWQLSDEERKQFDWIDFDDDDNCAEFFRYKGWLYSLDQFMRFGYPGPFGQTDDEGWEASLAESIGCGVVIKYPRDEWGDIDSERIIVGYWYA